MAIPRGINQTQPITQRAYTSHKLALNGIQRPREDHGQHKNKDGEYELRNMVNNSTIFFIQVGKNQRKNTKKTIIVEKDYS